MRIALIHGGGALIVLHHIGLLLRYIAALPFFVLPVSIYYAEWHAVVPLLGMAAAFLIAGIVLSSLPTRREPRLREGLLIAAVGWLVIPLGSILLFIWVEGWTPLNAYVETMSAWTGTGITVADVTALTHSTLMWRSVMQWVGGLGVIVLTLAILARPGTGAFTLYSSERSEDKLRPSVLSTVRTLWGIYVAVTLAGIALLLLVGMPAWDALNHGLTGISTAGMSVLPGGIDQYDDWRFELALMPIMIVGSLPFVATYALMRGRWRSFFRDEQVRAMFVVLAVAIPLGMYALERGEPLLDRAHVLRDAAFQVLSAVTTTGFQTANIAEWPVGMKLGLTGLLLVGGAAGSTAGGVKLVRGVLLLKGALWKLRRSGLPTFAVTTFHFGSERLSDSEANEEFAEAAFILVLWVALLFASLLVFLTLLPQYPVADVIFELSSLAANNGMTTGITTVALPDAAKVAAVLLMWAGRLEILPVLLLLRGLIPTFGKR